MAFLIFIFLLFSIVGLQWFSEINYYTCLVSTEGLDGQVTWATWSEVNGEDEFGICTPEKNQVLPLSMTYYKVCPEGSICGSVLEHTNKNMDALSSENPDETESYYEIELNEDLQFGIGGFTNIEQSFLTVF
jgi:hypothetical protein